MNDVQIKAYFRYKTRDHCIVFYVKDTSEKYYSFEKELSQYEYDSIDKEVFSEHRFDWTWFSKEASRDLWEQLDMRGYSLYEYDSFKDLKKEDELLAGSDMIKL